MKRFEYKIIYRPSLWDFPEESIMELRKLGEDGWELVAVKKKNFIFKREISRKMHYPM